MGSRPGAASHSGLNRARMELQPSEGLSCFDPWLILPLQRGSDVVSCNGHQSQGLVQLGQENCLSATVATVSTLAEIWNISHNDIQSMSESG